MRWGDILYLITHVSSVNDLGDIIEIPKTSQVFCNKKSIRQSEFWQAQASGLKPEIMFEMHCLDYNNETELVFDNIVYNIIRTYSKNGEVLELVCNRLIGTSETLTYLQTQEYSDSITVNDAVSFADDLKFEETITASDVLSPNDADVESDVGESEVGFSELG